MEFILEMLGLLGIIIGFFIVAGVVIYFFMSLFGNVKQYKPPARSKGPISEDKMKEIVYAMQLEKMKKKGAKASQIKDSSGVQSKKDIAKMSKKK